jgi:hydroxymethylpyrimidine pyrophosphatase-like HAD family hydrolase
MQKLSDIDFSKFKAAMFDYDGTLTEKGEWIIDSDLANRMGELLNAGFPIAVCTGRQVGSFAKRFGPTLRMIRENFGDEAAGRLYLLGENGSVGYEFSGKAGLEDKEEGWQMFFKADWPAEIPKEKFEAGLVELLGDKVEFLTHLVPIVLAPIGRMDMKIEDVYKASAEVYRIAHKYVEEFEVAGGGSALDHLHLGDSGLGVLICPAKGDKDSAIRVFYEFLGLGEDEECRKIMVVGDSPHREGNDYYFLNGRYGTAFSVGTPPEDGVQWPIVVRDDDGKTVMNSRGTLHLLNKLPF